MKWLARAPAFTRVGALGALVLLSACQSMPKAGAGGDALRLVLQLDDALFEQGYNRCDIASLDAVVSERVEFYHDQHGPLSSKAAFLGAIENGICRLDYRARRELVPESLQVHVLRREGVVYGLLQTGEHRFHARYPNEDERLTSIGRFSILWLLEDGQWRMARAISYDHRDP